jgi:TPP-dependent indolepyruvate ferredoxin oxidoreductase alpha subunit
MTTSNCTGIAALLRIKQYLSTDLTLTNKKTKNTILIDIAIPNTHNLAKTVTEKQKKYQELANEIRAMWKQGAVQAVPIVISTTGIIPKSLSQSLKRLNRHPNTYIQMENVVILGTCSIVRNFLNYTIRPTNLIMSMIRPRIGEYFPAKAEK